MLPKVVHAEPTQGRETSCRSLKSFFVPFLCTRICSGCHQTIRNSFTIYRSIAYELDKRKKKLFRRRRGGRDGFLSTRTSAGKCHIIKQTTFYTFCSAFGLHRLGVENVSHKSQNGFCLSVFERFQQIFSFSVSRTRTSLDCENKSQVAKPTKLVS
jgi:hypothetical protein